MAIVKMINVSDAGMKKQKQTADYILNPDKRIFAEPKTIAVTSNFMKSSRFNHAMHHKEGVKRWFKQIIVSLESERPDRKEPLEEQEIKLSSVLHECEKYYMKQGFESTGAVHCNTKHLHFHFLLDTCNCRTGKQWGQSKRDLVEFKEFVRLKLLEYGLDEENVCELQEVSEEIMLLEEEMLYPFEEDDFYDDGQDEAAEQLPNQYPEINANYWNIGTLERFGQYSFPGRDMCKIIDNSQGRVMCEIIDKTRGKVMCTLVDNPGRRDVVKLIDNTKKREMCRIVDKK